MTNQEKAIKALLNSGKSDLIAQGVNHYIKQYGIDKAKSSRSIKTKVNSLIKSGNLRDKSRGLKLDSLLYYEAPEDKLFLLSPQYKVLMDNAGLLSCY